MTCTHYSTTAGVCGRSDGTRHYLSGIRCPDHTPARLAGRLEANPDPRLSMTGRRVDAVKVPPPMGASAAIDRAAIASGKRRSTPAAYREARRKLRP